MALKLVRANWVRLSRPSAGMTERTLQSRMIPILSVHVESRQVFFGKDANSVQCAIAEEWQPAEGEFDKLVGCVCPTCKESFENPQALGSHVTRMHGKK